MTKYSDWIIIPADRKCDLPRDAKVQVMGAKQSVETASKNAAFDAVDYLNTDGKTWRDAFFAYRVVQEPVEEVREYTCWMNFRRHAQPLISWYVPEDIENWEKGTAVETTRDGKPYRFVWQAE